MIINKQNKCLIVETLFLLFLCLLSIRCNQQAGSQLESKNSSNVVASYLMNAELQVETDEQRHEIRRALSDMLEKSPNELRLKKYANYEGTPNVWLITQLLTAYFVPQKPQSLETNRFFEDVGKPEAKSAIRSKLHEIERALQNIER